MCLVCPVPNTYIGMQSCILVMMWWRCGGSATSYHDEVLGSTPQTWLKGLALSHVLRLTLSGVPKILLYCTEYNQPTTVHYQLNSCTTYAEHEWAGGTFLRKRKKFFQPTRSGCICAFCLRPWVTKLKNFYWAMRLVGRPGCAFQRSGTACTRPYYQWKTALDIENCTWHMNARIH